MPHLALSRLVRSSSCVNSLSFPSLGFVGTVINPHLRSFCCANVFTDSRIIVCMEIDSPTRVKYAELVGRGVIITFADGKCASSQPTSCTQRCLKPRSYAK